MSALHDTGCFTLVAEHPGNGYFRQQIREIPHEDGVRKVRLTIREARGNEALRRAPHYTGEVWAGIGIGWIEVVSIDPGDPRLSDAPVYDGGEEVDSLAWTSHICELLLAETVDIIS